MSGTVFHNLRGWYKKGWSDFHINPLDVRKIQAISYRKRMFCIFDRNWPHSIDIEYYNPRSKQSLSPVVSTNLQFSGVAASSSYAETSMMTVRYPTETEAREEVELIQQLQKDIALFDKEQNRKLAEFILKNKTK